MGGLLPSAPIEKIRTYVRMKGTGSNVYIRTNVEVVPVVPGHTPLNPGGLYWPKSENFADIPCTSVLFFFFLFFLKKRKIEKKF
jgi:hypothetical protein